MPLDGEAADVELAAALNAIGHAARQERIRAATVAARALTKLLKRLDNGRNWSRGWGTRGTGRTCLQGGLSEMPGGVEAETYFYAAIRAETGQHRGIIAYNDRAADYSAISRIIKAARKDAKAVADGGHD